MIIARRSQSHRLSRQRRVSVLSSDCHKISMEHGLRDGFGYRFPYSVFRLLGYSLRFFTFKNWEKKTPESMLKIFFCGLELMTNSCTSALAHIAILPGEYLSVRLVGHPSFPFTLGNILFVVVFFCAIIISLSCKAIVASVNPTTTVAESKTVSQVRRAIR